MTRQGKAKSKQKKGTRQQSTQKALTPKDMLFAYELLRCDFNVYQAAKNAGFAESTSKKIAHRWIGQDRTDLRFKPALFAFVEQLKADKLAQIEVSVDRVLEEFQILAFSDVADYVTAGPEGVTLKNINELHPRVRRAIAEVSQTETNAGTNIKFKLHDKKGPLESLAKYLNMFKNDDKSNNQFEIIIKDLTSGKIDVDYSRGIGGTDGSKADA